MLHPPHRICPQVVDGCWWLLWMIEHVLTQNTVADQLLGSIWPPFGLASSFWGFKSSTTRIRHDLNAQLKQPQATYGDLAWVVSTCLDLVDPSDHSPISSFSLISRRSVCSSLYGRTCATRCDGDAGPSLDLAVVELQMGRARGGPLSLLSQPPAVSYFSLGLADLLAVTILWIPGDGSVVLFVLLGLLDCVFFVFVFVCVVLCCVFVASRATSNAHI